MTLQLCPSEYVEQDLAKVLPVRWMQMFSQWYWVEQNCVLFRARDSAFKKDVFVCLVFHSEGHATQGVCYEVPLCEQSSGFAHVVDGARANRYEFFVQMTSKVVSVLSKFEDRTLIHTLCALRDGRKEIKIDLPRFGRSFLVDSSGQVISCQDRGYRLSCQQQLKDSFPQFQNYLILEAIAPEMEWIQRKLVVPSGDIVLDRNHAICQVKMQPDVDATNRAVVYDDHPRLGIFTSKSIADRLQLAALYAASGSIVPEKLLHMTGTEAALETLGRCKKNSPFTLKERDRLENLMEFAHQEPALMILACNVLEKSNRVVFLFDQQEHDSTCKKPPPPCNDQKTAYASMWSRRSYHTLRKRLATDFCPFTQMSPSQITKASSQSLVELLSCSIGRDWLVDEEAKLKTLFKVTAVPRSLVIPSFPLKEGRDKSEVGKRVLNQLEKSWKVHHERKKASIPDDLDRQRLLAGLEEGADSVQQKVSMVHDYLVQAVESGKSDLQSRLLGVANYLPRLTFVDLIRMGFDATILPQLSPNLSETSQATFREASLVLMELCVFEDKLHRLRKLVARDDSPLKQVESLVLDELMSDRQWESKDHPWWLAFEVEAGLQIRRDQFVVADHLIHHPAGTICQLNMGRGKTRVVQPMSFLEGALQPQNTSDQRTRVMRAHFLAPLLSETTSYLHQSLTASSMGLPLYELPFVRRKELSIDSMECMIEQVDECGRTGGVLILSPGHRQSLELKQLELLRSENEEDHVVASAIARLVTGFSYRDYFDEADAHLHHKNHLVYAIDDPYPLEDGNIRWTMAEHLLEALTASRVNTGSSEVGKLLRSRRNVLVVDGECHRERGGFSGIRLTQSIGKDLAEAFAKDLLCKLPRELRWMRGLQDWVFRAMTDPSFEVAKHPRVREQERKQLLVLRGLLAYGILEHCLQKRNNERYGIPPAGSRRPKKLAVPFVAADLPAENAEFTHPEVAIVLTLLGFYNNGLSKIQVAETLASVLKMASAKQQHYYGLWYQSVKEHLSKDEQDWLQNVNGIDLTEASRLEQLHRVYRYSTQVVNFYLNECVFPCHLCQYPSKIQRAAPHLVPPNNQAVGFSGTNDNQELLPLEAHQHEPVDDELQATNGAMLDLIDQRCLGYELIDGRHANDPNGSEPTPKWQQLLCFAVDRRASAIIDTGALLAGVKNLNAARFLLKLLEHSEIDCRGVTFYDTSSKVKQWMVLEKRRQYCFPRGECDGVLDCDTFVIFDEARSRGSDMNLAPQAVAMVTLGPNTTKDKVLQGCGRMRQLANGQRLLFASFSEVKTKIATATQHIEQQKPVHQVLQWALANTVQEIKHGFVEWADNEWHFQRTQSNDTTSEYLSEDWSLELRYGTVIRPEKMGEYVQRRCGNSEVVEQAATAQFLRDIYARAKAFGLDDEVQVSSIDAECERDLCKDEKQERHVESQVSAREPANESPWAYSNMVSAKSMADVRNWINVSDLESFLEKHFAAKALAKLQWTKLQVFGTTNFFNTVQPNASTALNEYLRVVDGMLVFEDHSVLLLSDYEADQLVRLLWDWRSQTQRRVLKFCFVHLAFLSEVTETKRCPRLLLSGHNELFTSAGFWMDHQMLLTSVGLRVFNGETTFVEAGEELLLRELLETSSHGREALIELIVARRGNARNWELSTLDQLCQEIHQERVMQEDERQVEA